MNETEAMIPVGERKAASGERTGTTAVDPICGMTVSTDTPLRSTRNGETFYFCSPSCKAKFDAGEQRHASGEQMASAPRPPLAAPRSPAPAAAKAEYTCPMHPEIVRDGPGACPICGMALEPRTVSLDDQPNPELADMRRRFLVSAILSVPLLAGMWLMLPPWAELVLAAPVVLWGGWPFFQRAWVSLVTRQLNMFTLIAMGTGVSFVYSSIAVILRQGPLYFEPAAIITVLVLLGQVLELRA